MYKAPELNTAENITFRFESFGLTKNRASELADIGSVYWDQYTHGTIDEKAFIQGILKTAQSELESLYVMLCAGGAIAVFQKCVY
jgi:hypothetical protein